MTRARCAECGALLAYAGDTGEKLPNTLGHLIPIRVPTFHPCGACLQEARADAIASMEHPELSGDEVRDEGRD